MQKFTILGLLILSLSLAPVPGTSTARASASRSTSATAAHPEARALQRVRRGEHAERRADTANGAKIFQIHCVGCHPKGGNIIRRGKNLKKRALKRNKMDSLQAIAGLVTEGKRLMSAYKDRLTAREIEDVSAYVLERAEKNWK